MHIVLKVVLAAGTLLAATGFAARDARAQGYGDRGQSQELYCASNDTRGSRCQMPWRDSVLAQQMSKAACIEGQTWGSDPYSVWIKGGCRGNFSNARGYGRPGYGGDRGGQEVYCASNDSRGTRCQMPWRYSELSRQMSDAACVEGRTWGSDPYSVWVKGGCRGQFRDARGGRPRW
ncbi:hypothetical protein B0E52_05445 [Rhodanobacter sp. C06]|uniref:DUF3011 domain-containing protein n=1 Tax=Rhodanobacter sp. C06 TaxID=1945854 RepID=UPI000984DAC5|nr:DUF3011 domain-containing protein [Rhodanobacter sp. C06]OOG46140.1 hypothetical protein B0E52_05445 [Rhodanobacter sp. C06]